MTSFSDNVLKKASAYTYHERGWQGTRVPGVYVVLGSSYRLPSALVFASIVIILGIILRVKILVAKHCENYIYARCRRNTASSDRQHSQSAKTIARPRPPHYFHGFRGNRPIYIAVPQYDCERIKKTTLAPLSYVGNSFGSGYLKPRNRVQGYWGGRYSGSIALDHVE